MFWNSNFNDSWLRLYLKGNGFIYFISFIFNINKMFIYFSNINMHALHVFVKKIQLECNCGSLKLKNLIHGYLNLKRC